MNEMIYPYDLKEATKLFYEEYPTFPLVSVTGEADGIVFECSWSAYKYFYEERELRQIS